MNNTTNRITLKDIAEETGFTINTVSRALKDKSDISQATKQAIRDVANRLGYVQDAVAGSLRSGVTRTIAVILGDISNPFLAMQVKAIELAAMKQGYSTFILNTDEDSTAEYQAILSAYGKKVDGILICPVQENEENVRFLQRSGLPFVLIGRHFKSIPTHAVTSDDRKGGFLAADYLLSQGHRQILFLNGPPYISSAEDRLQGFCDAHARAGVPVDHQYIRVIDVKTGAGRRAIVKVLAEGLPFTAVITFSDMLGFETRCVLMEARGKESASIPIVGFDNIQSRLPLPVDFISVGMVGEEWAGQAVDLLFQLIRVRSRAAQLPAAETEAAPVSPLDLALEYRKIVLDVKLTIYKF